MQPISIQTAFLDINFYKTELSVNELLRISFSTFLCIFLPILCLYVMALFFVSQAILPSNRSVGNNLVAIYREILAIKLTDVDVLCPIAKSHPSFAALRRSALPRRDRG